MKVRLTLPAVVLLIAGCAVPIEEDPLEAARLPAASESASPAPAPSVPVPNAPPIASFAVEVDGLSASVDAGRSIDPEGAISYYHWRWGDDTTNVVRDSPRATHTYASGGTYSIVLTISDAAGVTATDKASVTVVDPKPQAPKARFMGVTAYHSSAQETYWAVAEFSASEHSSEKLIVDGALTAKWIDSNGHLLYLQTESVTREGYTSQSGTLGRSHFGYSFTAPWKSLNKSQAPSGSDVRVTVDFTSAEGQWRDVRSTVPLVDAVIDQTPSAGELSLSSDTLRKSYVGTIGFVSKSGSGVRPAGVASLSFVDADGRLLFQTSWGFQPSDFVSEYGTWGDPIVKFSIPYSAMNRSFADSYSRVYAYLNTTVEGHEIRLQDYESLVGEVRAKLSDRFRIEALRDGVACKYRGSYTGDCYSYSYFIDLRLTNIGPKRESFSSVRFDAHTPSGLTYDWNGDDGNVPDKLDSGAAVAWRSYFEVPSGQEADYVVYSEYSEDEIRAPLP